MTHFQQAAANIRRWRKDPVSFVRENFKAEPDGWQCDVLMALVTNQRIAMKACKGPGKAQSNDLQIYTPSGQVTWGDLKPGHMVFAEDGTPTEIVKVYDSGNRDVYKVTFDDGSSTECCDEHLWKVRGRTEKRHKRWSTLPLKEIIARGITTKQGSSVYHQFQIPAQGAAQFKKKSLVVAPYLLGIWLGDGSRNTGIYSSMDDEIRVRINKLGYKSRVAHQVNRCDNIRVRDLTWRLRELGVLDKYSYQKSIPEVYKTSSVAQRKELLRGLMDSDGTIDKLDGHCEYGTTSKVLADDILWLVRSLGGKAKLKKTKKTTHRDCYRVTVTTPFNPFHLKRKAQYWKPTTQDRYLCRTIVDVKKIGKKDVSCIEIAHKTKCYLTNDFIVTHNTCLLAWTAWWFLVCYTHPKIAAISISADNLSDGLWSEMATWQNKSPFLAEAFQWTKTKIFAKDHHSTWWMSARTWAKGASKEQQANTLAGLHADNIMFLIDEAGGIPDAVMAAAEAALANDHGDGKKAAKLIMAGNPTHNEGPLYRASTKERHLWWITEITSDPDNPKRTPRVSIKWAREQIEKYGRDNPWVIVNVFGEFPPSSLNTLIGPDEVSQAMARHYGEDVYGTAQVRIGVDVARFGDDSTVIFRRQGLAAFQPIQLRNLRNFDIAARVASERGLHNGEMEFIDATGGYGGGVIDCLIQSGYNPYEYQAAGKASDPRYYNKRAEVWFAMAEWIKRGGALPNVPELAAELTAPTYSFKDGKLLLQSKDQIKEDLGRSPDFADALSMTFSMPEMPAGMRRARNSRNQIKKEYDPFV